MINNMICEDEVTASEHVPSDFGLDCDGPLSEELGTVEIPELTCPFSDDELY